MVGERVHLVDDEDELVQVGLGMPEGALIMSLFAQDQHSLLAMNILIAETSNMA